MAAPPEATAGVAELIPATDFNYASIPTLGELSTHPEDSKNTDWPHTEFTDWPYAKYIKVSVVSLVSTAVILSNIFNILGWCRVKHIAMATRIFLINLSVSDLCVGLIACAPSVYPAYFGVWPYGDIWCQMSGIVHGTSVTVSIWSISLVSIDRFLAVTWPLKYATMVTKGKCAMIIIGIWFCAIFTFLAPCIVKGNFIYYKFDLQYSMCGLYWEFPIYCAVTGLYIPIFCGSILIFTAIKIVQALNVSSKFRETIGAGNSNSANRKALRVIVATSVLYFIFWGPYVTQVVVESLVPAVEAWTPDWLSFTTLWLANSNSGINVFVYSMTNAGFRAHLKYLLLPCTRTSDEIQELSTAGNADDQSLKSVPSNASSIRDLGKI